MKRTRYDNAITRHSETTVALDRSRTGRLRATREEYDAIRKMLSDGTPYTFDGLIGPVEQAIAPHVPPLGWSNNPTRLSKEWYAEEVRDKMAFVRTMVAAKQPAVAAAAALELGTLLVEARAVHVWGADLTLGRKRRRDTQTAGRSRGQQIRTAASAEDQTTRRLVRQYHLSDEAADQSLVAFLVERQKRSEKTIRRRLKRLQIPTRELLSRRCDLTS